MRLRLQAPNVLTALVGLLFVAGGFYAYHYMGRYFEYAHETPGVVVRFRLS